MWKLLRAMVGLVAALTLTACGQGDVGSGEQASGDNSTSAALSSSVGGCSFNPETPIGWERSAAVGVGCNTNNHVQVQVCLQQLVTGGWETIDFTCADYDWYGSAVTWAYRSHQVPYWTAGRWYRSWAWIDSGGHTASGASGGFKG
jgi:hypothetical protein